MQVACDQAKNATARSLGQETPRFADDETTLDDLKARIAKTIDYVSSLPRGSFEGAEDRDIVVPLPNDRVLEMKGARFLGQWGLPHFYFHIVTAYDILRHKGVEIGKRDFMAHSGDAIRQRSGT